MARTPKAEQTAQPQHIYVLLRTPLRAQAALRTPLPRPAWAAHAAQPRARARYNVYMYVRFAHRTRAHCARTAVRAVLRAAPHNVYIRLCSMLFPYG